MEFEWDETKNEKNKVKHGFSFKDAILVLDEDHIRKRSDKNGEERWIAVGEIKDEVAAVIYTVREGRYRIISIRRARNAEKRAYRSLYQ